MVVEGGCFPENVGDAGMGERRLEGEGRGLVCQVCKFLWFRMGGGS